MAAYLRVNQYFMVCEFGVKVTEAQVRQTCKQVGDKVEARFLVLDRELVVARLDQCNALAGGCSMDDLRAAIEELLGT